MGEAKRRQAMGRVGRHALKPFLDTYRRMSNDDYIEVRQGHVDGRADVPMVVVHLGAKVFGFSPYEARIIADAAESAMNAFPNEPDSAGLPNLILAMRAGADAVERATFTQPEREGGAG
jgi:hypothetical protein